MLRICVATANHTAWSVDARPRIARRNGFGRDTTKSTASARRVPGLVRVYALT